MPTRCARPLLCVPLLVVSALVATAGEKVASDSPRATPAGATFTVPAEWSITTKGAVVALDAPEADTHIAIVDTQAKDADAAVEEAWNAYQPGFKRPLRLSLPQAPRNGWEERKAYQYETSPNERLVVAAYAWRAGASWTVVLLDGT